MAPVTSTNDMIIAPNIHPVCSGPAILLYLESSSPGPGVGLKVGVDVGVDVDVAMAVGDDAGVPVGTCRFYKESACWLRPILVGI